MYLENMWQCSKLQICCVEQRILETTFTLYRRENLKHGATLEAECEVEHLLEDSEERFVTEMHKYLKRCIEYHQKLLR
jgi:hypothetical protein